MIHVDKIGGVAHQSAGGHELPLAVDARECSASREGDELLAPKGVEESYADEHRSCTQLSGLGESSVDLALGARLQNLDPLPERPRRLLHVLQLGIEGWFSRIEQHGD